MLAKHYYPITLSSLLSLKYAFEGKNGGFYTVQYQISTMSWFLIFRSVFHKELAIRDVITKHELLKITDKLILNSLIISNRYTFSS